MAIQRLFFIELPLGRFAEMRVCHSATFYGGGGDLPSGEGSSASDGASASRQIEDRPPPPPEGREPGNTVNARAVRILLECILVSCSFWEILTNLYVVAPSYENSGSAPANSCCRCHLANYTQNSNANGTRAIHHRTVAH